MIDNILYSDVCYVVLFIDNCMFFFFKQKTAYEMRISDWSSDVCSSDLFPPDYDRQLLNADMQDLQSWAWGYEHITDINDFLYQRQRGMILTPGAWIIYGGKMRFTPPPTGDASFPYISKNYALDSGTLEAKPQFDADTDEFLLIDTNTAKGNRK